MKISQITVQRSGEGYVVIARHRPYKGRIVPILQSAELTAEQVPSEVEALVLEAEKGTRGRLKGRLGVPK